MIMMICMLFLVLLSMQGTHTLTIDISSSPDAVLGQSIAHINCSYVTDAGDALFLITLKVYKEGQFKPIATFSPYNINPPVFTADGQYLVNRANLTNPMGGSNTAILTLSQIYCEDETDYQCEVNYQDGGTGTVPNPLPTVETNLTVNVAAEQPDMPPSISASDVQEGDNVTFTCSGNIGIPYGRIVWERLHIDGLGVITYPNETTYILSGPENCTVNGESRLTLTMTKDDHNSIIKCKIVQKYSSSDVSQQTAPINVFYSVRDTSISRDPDEPSYIEGSSPITMQCNATGNPQPSFHWYKNGNNTVLSNTSMLVISDVIVENGGNYTCISSNTFNGNNFTETLMTSINIGILTTPPTTQSTPVTVYSSSTIKVDAEPQNDTTQENIPAIIGGSIGGIAVFGVAFLVYKYTCGKTVKYHGQQHGQITHFEIPIETNNPPRTTSFHLDMYNSVDLRKASVSKL